MTLDWKRWGQRLKDMRDVRGWSQRELAGNVSTSRNTVNRWEIGDRRPSMKMVERLARAFNISMWELLPVRTHAARGLDPDAVAPAYRLTVDVGKLLPLNQPFSLPLTRMMMATDDVRHLHRLLVVRHGRKDPTPSERLLFEGETGHLFRLLCSHLCEAISAFATLDDRCRSLLDESVKLADDRLRAEKALSSARAAREAILSKQGKRSLIHVVRNFVGFHYPEDQKLRRTIEKHRDVSREDGRLEGTFVLSIHQGIGRYVLADQVAMFLIADEMRGPFRTFTRKYRDAIGDAIELAGAVGDVVDYLLAHVVRTFTPDIEKIDDVIRVDPVIVRTRRAIKRRRQTLA
jgi:transcriptional regulator with XRE-family HTH domain